MGQEEEQKLVVQQAVAKFQNKNIIHTDSDTE